MATNNFNKRCFPRQTNVGKSSQQLYVWCVDTGVDKSGGRGAKSIHKISCDAKSGNQGVDNVVRYVYELVVVNGIVNKLAYVECDYVQ